MIRESVFVCTYGSGEVEHVAHVVAWDDREAAELFVRELEPEVGEVAVSEVRVQPIVHRFPANAAERGEGAGSRRPPRAPPATVLDATSPEAV